MRLVGLAYLCVLVVAVAAFRLHDPTESPPTVAESALLAANLVTEPIPEAPADPIRTIPLGEGGATEESQSTEAAPSEGPTRETVTRPEPRRRRYRRRRPNRYPDPPTPEEWVPPDGPVRIALQAGHWRADEAPQELRSLRRNGTRWQSTAEWEVNLEIVQRTGAMLEDLGYEVDILPAVVPPAYRAHLFIAIHADGSNDPNASGYRVASPSRDVTGRARRVAALLERSYGEATGIKRLPVATRRMRNYYAFNFQRYEHALHPMTIAVILETGFLTSRRDRRVIMDNPDRAARGIVEAVTAFSVTPPPAIADEQ